MDIKQDMKNIKDDVVKGADRIGNGFKHAAEKLGHAVKHTAIDLKNDVKGMSMEVGEMAGDMKDKYEDSKIVKEMKKQDK